VEYKSLVKLLYYWLQSKNQIKKSGFFFFLVSPPGDKPPKSFPFFLIFLNSLFNEISLVKKDVDAHH